LELIFLTYVNRSGSTYLASHLNRSEKILACPEAEILIDLFLTEPEKKFKYNKIHLRLKKLIAADKKLKYWHLSQDDIVKLKSAKTRFNAFLSVIHAYKERVKPKADIVVFKAERLIDLFPRIHSYCFNKYKVYFISVIRDCRAVYASQNRTSWPGKKKVMSRNPIRTAKYWVNHVEKILSVNSPRFYIIKYELLIREFSKVIDNVFSRLGVENPDVIQQSEDFYNRLPEDHKKIHQNLLSPPDHQKIEEWKLNLKQQDIYLIEKYSGLYLGKMDYQLSNLSLPEFTRWTIEGKYYLGYLLNKIMRKSYFMLVQLIMKILYD